LWLRMYNLSVEDTVENPAVYQLLKKFSEFFGAKRFITMNKTASQLFIN